MKTFKLYLREAQAEFNTKDMIFTGADTPALILSTTALERVFGELERINAWHVTDLEGLKGLKRAKRLVEDVVETDADRKKKLREKRKAEGRPKRKIKRKAGTAKPKKTFVEDKKAKYTKGAERKETGTRQKRIEKPVYKKKITPPAKQSGKGRRRGPKGRK